jgi:hypothetical protein
MLNLRGDVRVLHDSVFIDRDGHLNHPPPA